MSCEEMRQDCKEAFEIIHDRIDKRDKEITANTTDIKHLAKSMSALTKALWGIASAIIIAAMTTAITFIR